MVKESTYVEVYDVIVDSGFILVYYLLQYHGPLSRDKKLQICLKIVPTVNHTIYEYISIYLYNK